jgi:predicted MPP superfamily phosphohydrolase
MNKGQHMTRKNGLKRKYKLILIGVLLLGLAVWALWNQPVYRFYEIKTEKVTEVVRVVHLSDLHNSSYGKDNGRLLKMIVSQSPDIIVMTGDMVDDMLKTEAAYDLIDRLTDYPLYYVSGNHEHWDEDTYGIFEKLENHGVTILYDAYETIEINNQSIVLAGMVDPANIGRFESRKKRNYYGNPLDQRLRRLSLSIEEEAVEGYRILLSHRPEYYDTYNMLNYDLVLCGHAHGGQVRIPF